MSKNQMYTIGILIGILIASVAAAQRPNVIKVAADPAGIGCTASSPAVVWGGVTYGCVSSEYAQQNDLAVVEAQVTIGFEESAQFTVDPAAVGASFQAAIDYGAGLATVDNPIEVVILPGVFFFGAGDVVALTDYSYITIRGTARDATVLSSGGSTIFAAAAQSENMVQLGFADMTLESTGTDTMVFLSSENTMYGIDVHVSNVRFRGGGLAFLQYGSRDVGASRSTGTVRGCVFEVAREALRLDGALKFYSRGNVFQTIAGDSAFARATAAGFPKDELQIFQIMGQFTDSQFTSDGDRFHLRVPDSAGLAPSTSAANPNDVHVYDLNNIYRAVIRGAYIDIGGDPDNDNLIFGTGINVSGTFGRSDIYDSTIYYRTEHANNSMYGITHAGGGHELALHNVRVKDGNGPGAEYDINIAGNDGALYFDDTTYDTIRDQGTLTSGGDPPRLFAKLLTADNSIAIPATAAVFDALAEHRLFDDSAAENTSWRNYRTSDFAYNRPNLSPRARVRWYPVAGSSGSVVWQVGVCSAGEDDPYPCSVSVWVEVADAVCGSCSAGDLHVSEWFDLDPDQFVAGELSVYQVQRDGADGGDDLVGDAALVSVEIQYEVQ